MASNITQSSPLIDGDLVVWLEQSGTTRQIHYTFLGNGCPETGCLDNAIPLSGFNPWEIALSGHKIAFQNERYSSTNPDIYLYDLDNPGAGAQPVAALPDKQYEPDISGSWVTWKDSSSGQTELKARKLDGSAERVVGAADSYSLAGDTLAFRKGSLGDPDVGVYVLDLNEPAAQPQLISSMEGESLDIDTDSHDKVVWDAANPRGAPPQVYLHDLATGETQQVSRSPVLAINPVVSGTHIVWSDDRDGVRNLYHNRLGDRAQELAERYAPYLYLHHEEYFQPRPVGMFVDGEGAKLMERIDNWPDNTLLVWPELSLGSLGNYFGASDEPGNPDGGKYIDLPGNVRSSWIDARWTEWTLKYHFVNPYNNLLSQYNYPELYYARVTRNSTGDRVALQYWMLYYFNTFGFFTNFGNFHEGDWEMVQVDLEGLGELSPESVSLSQHLGGIKGDWSYVEKRGDHPIVYIAKGSHATYFIAGVHTVPVDDFPFDPNDTTEKTANGPLEPQVEVLPDVGSARVGSLVGGPYGWLAYQGAWGEIVGVPWLDAPQGPAAAPEHSGRWDDPFSWSDGLCNNGDPQCAGVSASDTYGSVASPVDIHLYDSAGNHVGINEAGSLDEQIPGAEYIEIPELHRKTIIIHGGDASAGYRFELEGTGEGTFDFTVGSPDKTTNSADTVNYVAVPVNASTRVHLELARNADYQLQVDSEGDGVVDELRPPDSIAHHDIDLNPPAAVSDLSLVSASSDTVTISFTAPGDDGNAGSAQYYDVRYSETPITEMNWKEAELVEIIPLPQPAGSPETVTITGLKAGTMYYFALKAEDEVLRRSELSNVAEVATTIPSLNWTKKRVYWASWDDYYNRRLSIDYSMKNTGTGEAFEPTVHASFCTPSSVNVVTPLPLTTGNLMPGASETIMLKYYVPSNISNFTTISYASCKDDAQREYWFPGQLP
ncbi:MAG: hypothetical protein C4534_02955 [Gaiellales bacterium]|nr:MAG: hypothetical protein C4534_02955 [Gaiellales bacterium]